MWEIETEFTVRLGGNMYIDTPNLLVFQGVPIFRIRRNDDDGMLGIDFDVYDASGQRVAIFAKGIVVHGDRNNYEIHGTHDTYSVTEKTSGRVIARVQRRGVHGAELDVHVQMYLPNGFLLNAGPEETNIGGVVMRGNTFRNSAAAIVIQ